MRRAFLALVAAVAMLPLIGTAPAKPIEPLMWLVGGTWSADASGLGPGTLRIETTHKPSYTGTFVRFTTAFVSTKGAAPTYDGNFYYDPSTTQYGMWYEDPRGRIIQGPVAIDGNITSILFESGDPRDGTPGQMRLVLTRKGPDLYTWALYNLTRDPIKPVFSLDYKRRS